MEVRKVAILGAGNGGITAAADLKERGFEVALYELPEFAGNINQVQNERLKLGRALGLKLDDARVSRVKRGYFEESTASLDALFNDSPVFS